MPRHVISLLRAKPSYLKHGKKKIIQAVLNTGINYDSYYALHPGFIHFIDTIEE